MHMSNSKRTHTAAPKRRRVVGTSLIKPKDLEARYGISSVTRWRWERTGKLPPRDVHDYSGEAIGWRPATLDDSERGPIPGHAP